MDCMIFRNNVCLQSYYVCTWSTLPTLSALSYQSSSLPSPISVLVYIDLVYVPFFLRLPLCTVVICAVMVCGHGEGRVEGSSSSSAPQNRWMKLTFGALMKRCCRARSDQDWWHPYPNHPVLRNPVWCCRVCADPV